MTQLTFELGAHFDRGYIADPYWPEQARVIDIIKESGMSRARSAANRRKALQEWLEQHDMTLSEFEELQQLAKRPFHTNDAGEIIIPRERVEAFLVATASSIRAASRPCTPDQVRSLLTVTEWKTGKTQSDGTWERFVVVSGGSGQKLSNQRGLRSSEYIENFDIHGTVSLDPDFVKPDTLRNALKWGGENIGIGASRKMGWGRFDLTRFEQV